MYVRVEKLEKFIDSNSLYSITPLTSQPLLKTSRNGDEHIHSFENANISNAANSVNSITIEEKQSVENSYTTMPVENKQTTGTSLLPIYAEAVGVDSSIDSFENETSTQLPVIHSVPKEKSSTYSSQTGALENPIPIPDETVIVIEDDPILEIQDSADKNNVYLGEQIPVRERGNTRGRLTRDGFELSSPKHTRHFCVLRFRRSINRSMLHSFI